MVHQFDFYAAFSYTSQAIGMVLIYAGGTTKLIFWGHLDAPGRQEAFPSFDRGGKDKDQGIIPQVVGCSLEVRGTMFAERRLPLAVKLRR